MKWFLLCIILLFGKSSFGMNASHNTAPRQLFCEDGKNAAAEQTGPESGDLVADAVKELKVSARELCNIAPTKNWDDHGSLDSVTKNLLHSLAEIVVADLGAMSLLEQGDIVHGVLEPLVRRARRESDFYFFATTLFNHLTEFINRTGEQGVYLLNNDPCADLMRCLFELVGGKTFKRADREVCVRFLNVFVPLWKEQSGEEYLQDLPNLLKGSCINNKLHQVVLPLCAELARKNSLYTSLYYDILDVMAAKPLAYNLTSVLQVQNLRTMLSQVSAEVYPRLIKNAFLTLRAALPSKRDEVLVALRRFIRAIPECPEKECEDLRHLESDLRHHEMCVRIRGMR